jgi:formylglycine-generating enzyme required for sulfatase activity
MSVGLLMSVGALSAAPRDEQRIALVELENNSKLSMGVVSALTDIVRGEVAELLKARFTMITKENIYELVDEQTCNEATGASCEVEMGRKLGAHYLISGSVTQLGKKLNLALKVHHTRSSKLLGVREESALSLDQLKERILPRVSRGASSLIDPSVASRESSFNEGLEALTSELSDEGSGRELGSLDDALKQLESAELEQREVVREGSDAEYQRELKRLEREQAARKAHERKAERDFRRVEQVANKSAEKGEVAVRLFMKSYGSHRLGNPKASEAQALLEVVQRRQLEERKARLAAAHLKVVRSTWAKAKRVVKRGDSRGEKALELFLSTYADHPMGNPLESEARAVVERAQVEREAKRQAQHRKRVERDWSKAKRLVKRGDSRGEKALTLFLKQYEGHELGNPLADEARSTFAEAKAERERAEREAHEVAVRREWSRIARVVKGGGKPAVKAVELFLKRYERHPLGNPLESDVRRVLDELTSGGRSSGAVSAGSGKAGIAWVRIPAGSFEMGSNDGDSDERPVHRVRVGSFLMSKTEVTVGQYRKCVEAGRCSEPNQCHWSSSTWTDHPSNKEDHPINCVDWGQARTFAKWVGADVDLPSEAEWEYAARGGQSYTYAGSNDVYEVGWYSSNSGDSTHSVGKKKANGFGLYDMSGNVYEWTLDEWHDSYLGAPSDGRAWGDVPTCRQRCGTGSAGRVLRGGGWFNGAGNLRVADRLYNSPVYRGLYLGFRLRRTIP